MAGPSRLYLPPSSGATGISPTPDAVWDTTTGFGRVIPSLTKTNTAFATQSAPALPATLDYDILYKQFVYPLPTGIAFTTAHTIKGQVLAAQNGAGNDLSTQIVVKVFASNGTTVQATLFGPDTAGSASAWNTGSLMNRKIPRGGPVALTASYVAVAGDYLVIEIGGRKHSNNTPGSGVQIRLGDNNATDLPEDETTTADNNTWIEFSTDLVTPPGGLMNYGVWML